MGGNKRREKNIVDSTNYPSLGAYDSHDEKLIDQHMLWVQEAGIDGLIVSWWGKDSFEDQALEKLLDGSGRSGLEMTIYYEKIRGEQSARSAAEEILEVLHSHGNHPAWMRHEGKPVIFIYVRALHQIGLESWREVVQRVNEAYPGGAILIGDSQSRRSAQIFDGIHTYNTAGILSGMSENKLKVWANETYSKWVRTAKREGSISTVTVIPGYDDTKVRTPGIRVARFKGRSYREQWRAAIAANPDWVLVTSWNEWHEGSEIEPSMEYGDAYLKMTAELATSFKGVSAVKLTPTEISKAALDGTGRRNSRLPPNKIF